MDLTRLRTFVTVAREANLTRAAEILALSQPAVSAHVKALEEILGLTLFERTPRGMRLTAAGRRLLDRAEAVLSAHRALVDEARGLAGSVVGVLRVGTVGDPAALQMGEMVGRLGRCCPNLELKLENGISGAILAAIDSGRLDGGFVVDAAARDELFALELSEIAIYLAVPPSWTAELATGDWETLLARPWVWPPPATFCQRLASGLFAARGVQPLKAVESDKDQTTRALVASGVGPGLLHEATARAAVQSGEVALVPGCRWTAQLSFVCLRRRQSEPPVAAFIALLRELWRL